MRGDERTLRVSNAITTLLAQRVVDRLTPQDDEAQLFMNCDLCSFIENRFHEVLDPRTLTDDDRARWLEKALGEGDRLRDPRLGEDEEALWIMHDGERAGTIALGPNASGSMVRVSSLYVFPSFRRKRIAQSTLGSVYQATRDTSMSGLRLSTYWGWQNALHFYLRAKLWVWSFKRSIEFVWTDDLPRYAIARSADRASFAVERDGVAIPLLEAKRHPKSLEWRETDAMRSIGRDTRIAVHAEATFALALALEGWPLLRSRADWDEAQGGDLGGPEVLAYKLACFEQWDRMQGFELRTPRIPGLPYEEIERLFSDDSEAETEPRE